MEFKDEVFGKVRFIPPDNPAHARVHQAELVARRVDGFDSGKLEVPDFHEPRGFRFCNYDHSVTICARRLSHR